MSQKIEANKEHCDIINIFHIVFQNVREQGEPETLFFVTQLLRIFKKIITQQEIEP